MAKLITAFLFVFIGVSILGAIMQGGGGLLAQPLTAAVDDDDVTLSVPSTKGFLNIDSVQVDNEKILYSSITATTFAVSQRGYNGTTATSHSKGAKVYTMEAGLVNSMAGYRIASISDAMGIWAAVTIPWAILNLLINVLAMNFNFLGTDLELLTYFWLAMGLGLLATIGIYMAGGRRV